MNYLAHAYLSGDRPSIMVGNFIGDHVKGRGLSAYPSSVQLGIRLHRFIDYYTDQHRETKACKLLLRPHSGRYAGIVVDMFYDHFLAANWNEFSNTRLKDFSGSVYQSMEHKKDLLPERAAYMLHYMQKHDWLHSYAAMEGLERALNGIGKRSGFKGQLQEAVCILDEHYDTFEGHFFRFLPEIEKVCEAFIQDQI